MSNAPSISERAAQPLTIAVNGRPVETRAVTLAALVDDEGHGGKRVATALNGTFVPGSRRADTVLKAGDRVEILTARQGG
jgi:sulfur carrier protein